jgi:hypothetical protein
MRAACVFACVAVDVLTRQLRASENSLDSDIPPSICELTRLETLDLSANALTGMHQRTPCCSACCESSLLATRCCRVHTRLHQRHERPVAAVLDAQPPGAQTSAFACRRGVGATLYRRDPSMSVVLCRVDASALRWATRRR